MVKKLGIALLLLGISSASVAEQQCQHLYQGEAGEAFQAQLDELTQTSRYQNNEVMSLTDANQAYTEYTRLIRQARDHIHIYTTVIEDNAIGLEIATQLVNKSLEGVDVNILYSPTAQLASSTTIITAMRNAGINVQAYTPQNSQDFFTGLLLGANKKVLIADSESYGLEAIAGGRNIGSSYFADVPEPQEGEFNNIWRGTDILIRGPVLKTLVDDFLYSFNRQVGEENQLTCDAEVDTCRYYPTLSTANPEANTEIRIVNNEPDELPAITQVNTLYAELIDQATSSIEIATPYFIPDQALLDRLHAALDAGVEVTILTNALASNIVGEFSYLTSAYYWPALIAKGAKIYLWNMPAVNDGGKTWLRAMDAKTLTVDQCVYLTGSWNFNGRSYQWSNEYGIVVTDPTVAMTASEQLQQDLTVTGIETVNSLWFLLNFTTNDYTKAYLYATYLSDYL